MRGPALHELLDEGHARGLYTAAAAGVSIRGERTLQYAGTLAMTDDTPVSATTLFDLASVSKTVVAAAAVALADLGRLDLDSVVASHLTLPDGSELGTVTLRMLLTHTSGLPAESYIWREPSIPPGQRLPQILRTPLQTRPGEMFRYSCLGYIALGAVLEAAAGRPLPAFVDEFVARPLGLASVVYGPVDPSITAATEDESSIGRGMVRGEEHDELAWYLGGNVGNSGIFATAEDVLTFADSFITGSLLSPRALRTMSTDMLEPGQAAPFGQGYGPRINDRSFISPLDGFGHTGFTGTLWTAYPTLRTAAVLLTNRVHPQRNRADLTLFRRQFGELVAELGREPAAMG